MSSPGLFGGRDTKTRTPLTLVAMNRILSISSRHCEKTSPRLMRNFVLATIAFGGDELAGDGLKVAEAQLAVSGERGKYPEFAGNVRTIEARPYWRDKSVSPSGAGYHYNHNAETYMEVGDDLGLGDGRHDGAGQSVTLNLHDRHCFTVATSNQALPHLRPERFRLRTSTRSSLHSLSPPSPTSMSHPKTVCLFLLVALSGHPLSADDIKPNVLLICVDDLRPELGCYGVDYIFVSKYRCTSITRTGVQSTLCPSTDVRCFTLHVAHRTVRRCE